MPRITDLPLKLPSLLHEIPLIIIIIIIIYIGLLQRISPPLGERRWSKRCVLESVSVCLYESVVFVPVCLYESVVLAHHLGRVRGSAAGAANFFCVSVSLCLCVSV